MLEKWEFIPILMYFEPSIGEGDSKSHEKVMCSEIPEIWSDKMVINIQPTFTLSQLD